MYKNTHTCILICKYTYVRRIKYKRERTGNETKERNAWKEHN